MKATRRKTLLALVGAMAVGAAVAAPSVEITSVQQQYPWTNMVDIVYTVAGVESETNGYFVVFTPTTSDGKEILDVNGEKSVQVALKGSGVYSTQWYPQTNQQYTACKMTPSVFRGAAKDYMIVDLETWDVYYEPMATQAASNQRYNTEEYKTNKLVLRMVGAGDYTIGDDTMNTAELVNTQHKVTVPEGTCYYMSIFPVTGAQYARVMGTSTTSTDKKAAASTWNVLRSSALANAKLTPNKDNKTSFLIRLSGLTGLSFDLPTFEMHEIATRAGVTTKTFWGTTTSDTRYHWLYQGLKSLPEVGGKLPNNWGFYDVCGYVYEWTLDNYDKTTDWAKKETDIYTPRLSGSSSSVHIRSACWDKPDARWIEASTSGNWGKNTSYTNGRAGFRVSVVFK